MLTVDAQPMRHRQGWNTDGICGGGSSSNPRGIVVSGVRRMNEVNARRARLVPGCVTVFRQVPVYHLGM